MTYSLEAAAAFALLMDRWKPAEKRAKAARQECTAAFAACQGGVGAGPSLEQLARADRFEVESERLWAEVEHLVTKTVIRRPRGMADRCARMKRALEGAADGEEDGRTASERP